MTTVLHQAVVVNGSHQENTLMFNDVELGLILSAALGSL